jgi:hypothetical protein
LKSEHIPSPGVQLKVPADVCLGGIGNLIATIEREIRSADRNAILIVFLLSLLIMTPVVE